MGCLSMMTGRRRAQKNKKRMNDAGNQQGAVNGLARCAGVEAFGSMRDNRIRYDVRQGELANFPGRRQVIEFAVL